jgi:hypothetical protein
MRTPDGVQFFVEKFGKQVEQQKTTFQMLAAAQMKVWRGVADTVQQVTRGFTAERCGDIEKAAARQERRGGGGEARETVGEACPAVVRARRLAETRAAFDRANQAAWSAFK